MSWVGQLQWDCLDSSHEMDDDRLIYCAEFMVDEQGYEYLSFELEAMAWNIVFDWLEEHRIHVFHTDPIWGKA